MIIGRPRQYSRNESNQIIRCARFKIGAVATIVKDDEDPHYKCPCQDGQRHDEPPRHRQAEIHQVPKQGVGNERVHDLPERPRERGLLVLRHNLFPDRDFWLAFALSQIICHNAPLPSAKLFYKSRTMKPELRLTSVQEEPLVLNAARST